MLDRLSNMRNPVNIFVLTCLHSFTCDLATAVLFFLNLYLTRQVTAGYNGIYKSGLAISVKEGLHEYVMVCVCKELRYILGTQQNVFILKKSYPSHEI